MLRWKGKLAAALLLLVGIAVCLKAGASGSEKKEPPTREQEAALVKAWQAWREMERQQIREHLDARLHLAECNLQMLKAQKKLDEIQVQLQQARDGLNNYLRAVARPDQDPIIQRQQADLKSLERTQLQRKSEAELAEKNHMRAEEDLQALEREQALRRDLLRARLEAAEGRLHPREDSEPGSWQRIERRLEQMDRKLERLDSELSKLRRQLETRNPKTGP